MWYNLIDLHKGEMSSETQKGWNSKRNSSTSSGIHVYLLIVLVLNTGGQLVIIIVALHVVVVGEARLQLVATILIILHKIHIVSLSRNGKQKACKESSHSEQPES